MNMMPDTDGESDMDAPGMNEEPKSTDSDDGEPDMEPMPPISPPSGDYVTASNTAVRGMPKTLEALSLLGHGQPYKNRNK